MSDHRMVVASANVEVRVVDAEDETKVRHQFKASNALGVGLVQSLVSRNASYTTTAPIRVGMSGNTVPLTTSLVRPVDLTAWLASFWGGCWSSIFAYRDINAAGTGDSNGIATWQYSSTDVPPWFQITAKFLPPYGNGSVCKTLWWGYNGYISTADAFNNCTAVYVMNSNEYFTKTAQDVVYIIWRVSINCTGRTNNAF